MEKPVPASLRLFSPCLFFGLVLIAFSLDHLRDLAHSSTYKTLLS